ncbi:hypothetical protein WN867_11535, partial [Tetragenococcus halophilus]|uniref:hypothetical protein n=1 Tax=Tetragenococcus halophilus TaxID=51669 RepID=UPI0030C965FB
RENNIKVTSLSGRMRYPQIFINHSGSFLLNFRFGNLLVVMISLIVCISSLISYKKIEINSTCYFLLSV